MKTPTFMILPSLLCQAQCNYCFGPFDGKVMDEKMAELAIRFVHDKVLEIGCNQISIVFHGGEPLLAPISVWKVLLNEIECQLADFIVDLSVQSNLWNLNQEFLDLFFKYNVAIGTSIDGPQDVCSKSRGKEYFEKTYASMKMAQRKGCSVSAIATVTKENIPNIHDTLEFFKENILKLNLHPCVPLLADNSNDNQDKYVLSPDEYSKLIKDIYPWYIKNSKFLQINSLDYYPKGITWGNSNVCTFNDCSRMFIVIDPNGDITACQRFAGNSKYRLGNIMDNPTLDEIYRSENAKKHQKREKMVKKLCGNCNYYEICKGGCYYNAEAANGFIDPYCTAIKDIYSFVENHIMNEVGYDENIDEVVNNLPNDEHFLFRKGDYIQLGGKNHPSKLAGNSRMILALYELGKSENNPHQAALNLYNNNIIKKLDLTEKILENIEESLYSNFDLTICFIYMTYNCNLQCNYCFAHAGKDSNTEISMDNYEKILKSAIKSGFHEITVTGGEPLNISYKNEFFRISKYYKNQIPSLTLRTNLYGDIKDDDFKKIAESFTQIIVSVDGEQKTHDAQRGEGTYESVVKNLKKYMEINEDNENKAEIALSCNSNNIESKNSLYKLAEYLKIKKIKTSPILPIDRASNVNKYICCDFQTENQNSQHLLKKPVYPKVSCGLGENISIDPEGNAYPCHVLTNENMFIGNVFEEGLENILKSEEFLKFKNFTVDTNKKCKNCDYRYLCEGACRAWGNQNDIDLDDAPINCEHLKNRAIKLVKTAEEYLKS